jgi:predicted LPLAT superfamily acyltransferase
VIRRIHRKAAARLSFEVIDIQRESFDYLKLLVDRLTDKEGLQFVPVEFLGIVQPFATGTASLAKISGASLIPIFCFEQEDGTVSLVLEEPIDLRSCGSGVKARVQVVTQYAGLLEAHIHEYPGQFSRWHNLPQPRRAEVYFTNGRAGIETTKGD